jgi:hypothetical protein
MLDWSVAQIIARQLAAVEQGFLAVIKEKPNKKIRKQKKKQTKCLSGKKSCSTYIFTSQALSGDFADVGL